MVKIPRSIDLPLEEVSSLARTVGTASLLDLIDRGALKPDEEFVLRRRSKPPIKGTLTASGRIRVGNKEYDTPTSAARAALNVPRVNGWARWRVPRLNDVTLTEVREST